MLRNLNSSMFFGLRRRCLAQPQNMFPHGLYSCKFASSSDVPQPQKFTESRAFEFVPEKDPLRLAGKEDEEAPWSQPYIIKFSLLCFLAYFCILREENDIDERLGSLSSEQEMVRYEIDQLKRSLQTNKDPDAQQSMEERLSDLLYQQHLQEKKKK